MYPEPNPVPVEITEAMLADLPRPTRRAWVASANANGRKGLAVALANLTPKGRAMYVSRRLAAERGQTVSPEAQARRDAAVAATKARRDALAERRAKARAAGFHRLADYDRAMREGLR